MEVRQQAAAHVARVGPVVTNRWATPLRLLCCALQPSQTLPRQFAAGLVPARGGAAQVEGGWHGGVAGAASIPMAVHLKALQLGAWQLVTSTCCKLSAESLVSPLL